MSFSAAFQGSAVNPDSSPWGNLISPRQTTGDDFSPASSRYFIHFIETLKRKLCFAVVAADPIQIKTDGSKAHLALAALPESDETGFLQINEILVPLLHLDQTPSADYFTGHGSILRMALLRREHAIVTPLSEIRAGGNDENPACISNHDSPSRQRTLEWAKSSGRSWASPRRPTKEQTRSCPSPWLPREFRTGRSPPRAR